LSIELLKLADEPQEDCQHDNCLVMNGVLRDCAWKIRNMAQHLSRELELIEKMQKDGSAALTNNDTFRSN